jgi:hypothetical protein
MAADEGPGSALRAFVSVLETLKVPYFVGGSVASSIRGQFRTTNDIDIICALKPKHLQRLFPALKDEFLVDEVAVERLMEGQETFNIIHEPSFMKIDVFTKIGTFEESEMARSTEVPIPNESFKVQVASAEDIILSKLNWFKKGNEASTNQWGDTLAVIKVHKAKLDLNYMHKWARELEIENLLDRLLADSIN